MVNGPLDGVRVLDLTRFVAGSQTTALLAALGADVVKVEVPPDGDPYRKQGTAWVGDESALFLSLNSGKRSLALDFRAPAAAPIVEALLDSSDFLVENSRPAALARYALDWETVHARHPTLIYGSISGYGDVGPEADRGGFDLILQADSGVMSVTGSSECGPVKIGVPVLDVGAGVSCALGLLAAYVERQRTGVGSHVTASLLEFALTSLGTLAAAYFAAGQVPGLLGTNSPTFAPYGGFRTADGSIVIAGAGSEDMWIRCCRALGVEELLQDPRFADNASRVHHRDELTELLEARLKTAESRHWLDLLAAAGVPASRIRDIRDVFAGPQPTALGAVQVLQHSTVGTYRIVGAPLRIDGAPLVVERPAPVLGADTRDVLQELGVEPGEIDGLIAAGTVVVA